MTRAKIAPRTRGRVECNASGGKDNMGHAVRERIEPGTTQKEKPVLFSLRRRPTPTTESMSLLRWVYADEAEARCSGTAGRTAVSHFGSTYIFEVIKASQGSTATKNRDGLGGSLSTLTEHGWT